MQKPGQQRIPTLAIGGSGKAAPFKDLQQPEFARISPA